MPRVISAVRLDRVMAIVKVYIGSLVSLRSFLVFKDESGAPFLKANLQNYEQ